MSTILAHSDLSQKSLKIYLSNQNGYPQDAFKVTWTVFSNDGSAVSGRNLPAVRNQTGEYYAPWNGYSRNGNHSIVWEVQSESGLSSQKFVNQFFVVDPSSYNNCGPLVRDGVPEPNKFIYLSGSLLGRGDLPLFLTNSDGLPANAYSVMWTIIDPVGCPITARSSAVLASMGEYYAPWLAGVGSGDYRILWEWMENSDSPIKSSAMDFSIIRPASPFGPITPVFYYDRIFKYCGSSSICLNSRIPISCCPDSYPCFRSPQSHCNQLLPPISSCSSNEVCCMVEVLRTIHINSQTLPALGAYTDQTPYLIPRKVRHIAFSISYTRGNVGGYAIFKLLWGDGTDEIQETIIGGDALAADNETVSQSMLLGELSGPIPSGPDLIKFNLSVTVPGAYSTVRLLAREGGVTGSPGTIGITLTASS